MLLQTPVLMGVGPLPGWLSGFVFGATVFAYNFAAAPARRWPAWALGAGAAFCYYQLPVVQQGIILAPALIWWLYDDRRRVGRFGLRRFPALKPLSIALAWAWVTVLLPLPPLQWTGAAALFVGRAAFIFALALAYDLCDLAYDRRQGLTTLVMQLGARGALRLVDAVLLLATGCVCLNAALGRYPWPVAGALLLSLLISRWCIRYLPPRGDMGDWRKVGIDGLMVLQYGLVCGMG